MSRNIKFVEGEYYHLYNRGTEKRKIFLSKNNYERFLMLLYICNNTESVHLSNQDQINQGPTLINVFATIKKDTLVDLCTYCLMPNHFHLLIREKTEGGISKFMQKLLTAYTMYFNIKNERTGSLFESRFKAKHADRDEYLKYLISYIHLNPIKLIEPAWKETGIKNKKEAEKFLQTYTNSSYLDYSGKQRLENLLLNKTALPEYFESPKDFAIVINTWLSFNEL